MNIRYDYAKPINLIEYLIRIGCEKNDIVVDFFAGSGTTAEAVVSLNTKEGANRKFMCVQLPERPKGNKNNDFSTLAEIAKKRIKIFLRRTRELNPLLTGDLGFRVFKLDSTNIREWDPNPDSLAESLEAAIEHLKSDRSEQDILFELLLKLGLDLCVPIEQRSLPGCAGQDHTLHSIGAGTLMVCLSTSIPLADVEPLALALVAWHGELQPAGDTTVVFRDSAFPDDVAKTNLTAILQQHGLESVRSL
jgi:adenine-specific DNA-methyltransferase